MPFISTPNIYLLSYQKAFMNKSKSYNTHGGKMSKLSKEEIAYLKYQIYSYRYDEPWITNKKVAAIAGRSISTINRYAQQAEAKAVFWNPHPRLKPYSRKKVSLLLFENKYKAFNELKGYPGVDYLCVYQGDWNILVSYNGPIDFTQFSGYIRTVTEGVRGRVFAPKVSYTSWESSFNQMETFLKQREAIEKTNFACDPRDPNWDEEDWVLYYYFAYDLRRSFSKLRKKYLISWRKYQKWKETLTDYCTVVTCYFPGGLNIYNGITLRYQTDYEQYIVDLLSCLPVTPIFYKIGPYIMVTIYHPRIYQPEFKIFEIISVLLDDGIIKDYMDGHGFIRWQREFID